MIYIYIFIIILYHIEKDICSYRWSDIRHLIFQIIENSARVPFSIQYYQIIIFQFHISQYIKLTGIFRPIFMLISHQFVNWHTKTKYLLLMWLLMVQPFNTTFKTKLCIILFVIRWKMESVQSVCIFSSVGVDHKIEKNNYKINYSFHL